MSRRPEALPVGPEQFPELPLGELFFRYAAVQPFLVEDGHGVRARAAAILNPRLPGLGQIGYFACEEGPEAGRAILESACAWLAARGARTILGPMNGAAHRPHRLMTRGFDTDPFLLGPRNPPWAPAVWESAGFAPAHRWSSYELDAGQAAALEERLAPAIRRARRHYEAVELDPKETATTLPRLHRLLDGAWSGHAGYAPFGLDEFAETYGPLLALLGRENLGVIADRESGEDVALGFCYSDLLAPGATGGRTDRLVLHTVAARPGDRGLGAPYLMLAEGLRVAREHGYARVLIALVTEEFRFFGKQLPAAREYALYGKGL